MVCKLTADPRSPYCYSSRPPARVTSNCSKRDCRKRERVLTPCLDRADNRVGGEAVERLCFLVSLLGARKHNLSIASNSVSVHAPSMMCLTQLLSSEYSNLNKDVYLWWVWWCWKRSLVLDRILHSLSQSDVGRGWVEWLWCGPTGLSNWTFLMYMLSYRYDFICSVTSLKQHVAYFNIRI